MLSYVGLPYNIQTNFSSSFIVASLTVNSAPMVTKVLQNSWCFSSCLKGVILPFRTNELVVSHPVNECSAIF